VPVTWDLLPYTHYTFIAINLIMWISLIISNQKDPGDIPMTGFLVENGIK
jgi:hypothetical protein